MHPNLVLAIGISLVMVMVLGTAALTAVAVIRPRMRMKRRMADLGLLGGPSGGKATGDNPRQKRIQEKLKELEDKSKNRSRRNQIRANLLQAGVDMDVKNYLMVSAIVGIAAAVVPLIFGLGFLVAVPAGLVGTLALPKFVLRYMAKKRQKAFTKDFANAVDVLVRGIRSGLPVGECLSIIGREMVDPIGEEFRLIVEGQKIGVALEDVLARGLERIPTAEFKFFAIVLQIQQQTGGNLAETLANLSTVLRDRKKMRDKVVALSSEARSSAGIIGALPLGVLLLTYSINKEFLEPLFYTTPGNFLLAGAAVWMMIGVLIMRQMINFEL